jgi:prepilin peptidase CpaA
LVCVAIPELLFKDKADLAMLIAAAGLILFPMMMAYAASSDLLTMKIPNKLNLTLAVTYFVMAIATGQSMNTILVHVACAIVMLLLTFGMFSAGWMGGGDAKLAAATALWMGFPLTLEYALASSFLGGVLTLAILVARSRPLPDFMMRQKWIAHLHDKTTGIPYGIALAAGGLLLYPQTDIWISLSKM